MTNPVAITAVGSGTTTTIGAGQVAKSDAIIADASSSKTDVTSVVNIVVTSFDPAVRSVSGQ